jgi:YVTN family beta-propeller protein
MARLDPRTGVAREYPPAVDLGGGTYSGLTMNERGVWVMHPGQIESGQSGGAVDHVDPATGQAVQHVPIESPAAIAVGDGPVWAVSSDGKSRGRLVSIDSSRDVIVGAPVQVGRDPAGVAVGRGAVWVANRGDDSVWRIDPKTRAVTAKVDVGDGPTVIRAGVGGVWVVNAGDSTITRIDPASNEPLGAPISLGKQLQDLVVTNGAVWVAAADGTVTRLDPASGRIIGFPLSPAQPPLALATDGVSVWAGSAGDKTISHIEEGRR